MTELTQEEIRTQALEWFFNKQAREMSKRNYYGKLEIVFQAGSVHSVKVGVDRILMMKDIIDDFRAENK